MYLPYPGFFHKLSQVDTFVIMDDVQYDKRFTNRNKILDPQGATNLTIPINKKHKFFPNMIVEINNDLPWGTYHWKKMQMCYANSRFFGIYRHYFENLYKKRWDLLFELDLETVKILMEWLGIKIPIIRESELNVSGDSTERLINVCKKVGAEAYLSGRGGRNYINEKLFERNSIRLFYQQYFPIPYSQKFTKEFWPDLSVVDMIFNLGEQSRELILESGSISLVEENSPITLPTPE